jgi:Putative transposase
VWTVPHALQVLVLANTRLLRTRLCRTGSQSLLPCGPQHLGGHLGAPMVLPTWDQTRNAHCSLHGMGPAGALAEDGTRGVPTHPRVRFPGRALRTVCRAKCLTALPQASPKEAWRCAQASAWCGAPPGFTPRLDQLSSQAWVVYAKRPCVGATQGLASLGRSIHRRAMAQHRLLGVRNGRVRCRYRTRRPGHQVHTLPLEAQECLRRFLLHRVPHGCQRLRQGGCLANRWKARTLRQCRHLRGQPTAPPMHIKLRLPSWTCCTE